MARVVIALGSNLADPHAAVVLGWQAVCAMARLRDARCSPVHATAPAEEAAGPRFANAVGVAHCRLSPRTLLAVLHRVERAFGRDRDREGHHGARPLDLDLLDVDGMLLDAPDLQLPHPRLAQRRFVLAPLREVAPDFVDRRSGHPVDELWRALETT